MYIKSFIIIYVSRAFAFFSCLCFMLREWTLQTDVRILEYARERISLSTD